MTLITWLLLALVPLGARAQDTVVFNFETGGRQGWQVVEGDFGKLINDRGKLRNRPDQPWVKEGRYFLDTVETPGGAPDDAQTGVVESPLFLLTGPRITFLQGGGNHPDTRLALCTEDGQEVLTSAGPGDEVMVPREWDATPWVGRRMFVRVTDHNTGPWGHVTMDNFRAEGRLIEPPPEEGMIRWDFETGDLQGWRVVDGAFGALITDRSACRNTPGAQYNKQGKFFLSTTELADGGYDDTMTGVVDSPAFTLLGPDITFLVGGGGGPDVYIALCTEDGTEVCRTQGMSSEDLREVEWDVPDHVGKTLFLEVVDNARGGWGHITLDDVRLRGKVDPAASERVWASLAQRQASRAAAAEALAALRAQGLAEHLVALNSPAYLMTPGGEPTVYSGEHLGAISLPLGGIGSGSIFMDGQARRHVWQCFNNLTQAQVPESFLAVRAAIPGQAPVVRVLQTIGEGAFAPMQSLAFRGEYPFGWYDFTDAALPVRASLEAFSPLVPLNARDSAFPCAVFRVTLTNPGAVPAEVSLLATQLNASGYTGHGRIRERRFAGPGGNTNRILHEAGASLLHLTGNGDAAAPGHGDMALLMDDPRATGVAQWADLESLAGEFAAQGALAGPAEAGPSARGRTLSGALCSSLTLQPGEARTVTVVLAWHFPNAPGQGWGGEGRQYTHWWSDALAVAREVGARLPELTDQTRLYHDSLYASNLPRWLLDRASSQVAILRTGTCFWTKDGYFGGWEGCGGASGCCAGNCSHVWHYAQAHARLFPQIGRLMREQEFADQQPDGGVPHRQLAGTGPALDGECGAILGAYREHLVSPDGKWLHGIWPRVRAALEHLIKTWDPDEDGVLAGPQWNTLDSYLGGSSSWLGSLYLASLAAGERMARLEDQPDLSLRYQRILAAGAATQDATLFNGEYYIQLPDAEPQRDYRTGCHIDQVLGQWWAAQLDLGWLYPREHVSSALGALLKHNFYGDFRGIAQSPRKFVDDHDAGMQMTTWPRGGKPEPGHDMVYAGEVMTGFEYSTAAAMIQCGMLEEGLRVARAIHDRYDGRERTGLTGGDTASWGYSGNPFGDDECGKYYARAMSSWSLLLACQGFGYDGPAGALAFRPVWQPADHRSFFTAAEGYGVLTQSRAPGRQTDRVEVKSGRLALRSLSFELPAGARATGATVRVPGQELAVALQAQGEQVTLTLAQPLLLIAGQDLTVELAFQAP